MRDEQVIDLHCHILPSVDDGPRTAEGAIELIRGALADGTTTIAATPHVDSSHRWLGADRLWAATATLQEQLHAAEVDVTVVPGAELGWTRAIELADEELRRLSLGGAGTLLLECPVTSTLTPGFTGVARKLARRGHRILLAHPERCPIFLRSPELLDELVDEGLLAQVTASALTGRFGRSSRELAIRLVMSGSAQVVASDGHDARSRPAVLAGEVIRADIDPELAIWLTDLVPSALLTGSQLPARPEPGSPRARSGLLRFGAFHSMFTREPPA